MPKMRTLLAIEEPSGKERRRGEPWRIRTSDPLIKSQLLYQLS